MLKKILLYILIIGGFVTLIFFVIQKGNKIERIENTTIIQNTNSQIFDDKTKPVDIEAENDIFHQLVTNIKYPLSILLLQVLIILVVSKIFGLIFKKLGQQTVIGEIIAGIFLGPSLIG